MKQILVSLLLLAFAASAAHAERRVALVIGNSGYEHVTQLTNPDNDAKGMAEKLTSLDFEVVTGTNLSLRDMRKTVREFIAKLEGADIALFFYAGHGLQVSGENYLVPIDAELNSYVDLEFEAMPANLVLNAWSIPPRSIWCFWTRAGTIRWLKTSHGPWAPFRFCWPGPCQDRLRGWLPDFLRHPAR